MRKQALSVSLILAAFLATPTAVLTPAEVFAATVFDEITVVARKTTENLQEVPLAITALGTEEIDRLGLKDLNQIAQQDTSVQFDEGFAPSDTRITIRGLSPTRGRPNAATLVDGIDVSSEAVSNAGGSLLINPRLVDVKQIEIVKGPQSALYGRSAFAGALQYITKDPGDEFEADLSVDWNSEEDRELKGTVSVPLTDTLGMLVTGLLYDNRGSYKNDPTKDYLGGAEGHGLAVTFKWEPSDTVDVKWRTEYTDEEYDPPAQVLLRDFMSWADLGTNGVIPAGAPPGTKIAGVGLAPFSSRCSLSGTGSLPIDLDGDGFVDATPSAGLPGPLQGLGGPFCTDPATGRQWAWSVDNDDVPVLELRRNGNLDLANYFDTAAGTPLVQFAGGGFNTPGSISALGGYTQLADFGTYSPGTSIADANLWNRQVIQLFIGRIPDADKLNLSVSPDYRKVDDPLDAKDFDGTTKEVGRTSLVVDWDINDDLTFTSLTGYTFASVETEMDIAKLHVDRCRPDTSVLMGQPNPLLLPDTHPLYDPAQEGSYYDYLVANDLNPDAYAPCTDMRKDGINDIPGAFLQDSDTDTKQISQEVRLAWQVNDTVNLTGGMLLWKETVDQFDVNNSLITGGAGCFWQPGDIDQSYFIRGFAGFTGFDENATQTDPVKDQCGQTSVVGAYWLPDAHAGRLMRPSQTDRQTDHQSWYGSLDVDFSDRFTMRVEARLTKEDNKVTGPVMTPCLDGSVYYNSNVDANGTAPGDGGTGTGLETECDNGATTPSGQPDGNETANAGTTTGPSTVLLCGQNGRCDRLAVSQANYDTFGWSPATANGTGAKNAWWAWGFKPTPFNTETLKRTDRFWAPKVTFEYLFDDDILGYASWSRGIKPGGFSLLTSGAFGLDANLDNDFDEIEFDEERLDVWEFGVKSTLADGKLRLNGAYFFQDFKDKQVSVQKVTGGTTGTEVVNIDGSEVHGLEIDATWLPTDNWRLQLGYTYLDTEYTDYVVITQSAADIGRIQLGNGQGCIDIAEVPGSTATAKQFGCVSSYNGNELERAPEHALLLNANYTNNLYDTGKEWYANVAFRYQDARWMEAFNITELKAHNLTDVSFGIMDDMWDVQFYINNLLDDETVLSGGPQVDIPTANFNFGLANPTPPTVNAGPKIPSDIYANLPNPRTAGVRFKLLFGQ
ncbi:MAG: TonB-dependent receptor [Gammaproteobacteria bacterium]|jgi:outer membrane receptor protein involved in Fe transport|nr:TonB-dependent receptor [Gammaproteobacteria bacterium]MDP6616852.1 TonB-dependent receptor [Gammaproteobacteria bacterium]MDP6694588.1 TonB-dependent receptor [Gammaproteobacteria bacterium]